jgi:hypothetical protein
LTLWVEASLFVGALIIGTLLYHMQWISLYQASLASIFYLFVLQLLALKRFDGGRHPAFLFLGLLILFQAGRPLGSIFDNKLDPFVFELQTATPFDVSPLTSALTILAICLSALCVYLPCRFRFRPVTLISTQNKGWLPALYTLFVLTLPFAAYKNFVYLQYIRDHGGYLAVYTDNEAIVASAGLLVRTISLIASNLFMVIFLLERRPTEGSSYYWL